MLTPSHDAVASALGPGEDDEVDVLTDLTADLIEELRRTDVDRVLRVGSAGRFSVRPDTTLIETDEYPDELVALARTHIDALELIWEADVLEWSALVPAIIESGKERASTEPPRVDSSPTRTRATLQ
nr:hypothetical protein [Natrinema sp. SYSU A 869]